MFCTLDCPSIQETWENSLKLKFLKCAGTTVLRNKVPRWHEHLQCWCLNFHGRVTVASVKNFQLVVTTDPSHPDSAGDNETVILQFGKKFFFFFFLSWHVAPTDAAALFILLLRKLSVDFITRLHLSVTVLLAWIKMQLLSCTRIAVVLYITETRVV
ncbi:hypothetical protein PR202_ga05945 [Eleusine coracana subsp. coracana]|uniref:Tubby C-terminal domain-containing protein n=1 Tax=Eleusine coracana subsp. coracana TaxID=191504 RepID=A0AAV5BTS2_ELECO|nr:hypothetical protein PR202_ga05945 [Eleusine coracana subsp. coracana]